MSTFAPFNLNSLRDLNKDFIYLSVNKGIQDFKEQPPGKKGKKGLKHLSTLLTFYSCLVGVLDEMARELVGGGVKSLTPNSSRPSSKANLYRRGFHRGVSASAVIEHGRKNYA